MQPVNHSNIIDKIAMNNNDILRRTRYILDLKDNQITKIFKHVEVEATEQQVNLWLKREDEPGFVALPDQTLIDFLDALIIERRGRRDDAPSVRPTQQLDNNLILMKMKIAFHLKAEEALAIMELAEFRISKHEFSALFRKKDHKHYRACKNQMLRKFMKGLQIKYRGQSNATKKTNPAKEFNLSRENDSPQKTIIKDVVSSHKTGKLSIKKKAPVKTPEAHKSKLIQNTAETKSPDSKTTEKPKSAAASVWKIPKKPNK